MKLYTRALVFLGVVGALTLRTTAPEAAARPLPNLQVTDAAGTNGEELSKAKKYFLKGVEYQNNSRYLDAVEQFQLALDEDPTYVDARRRLALVYTQMGQTEADYYQDALDTYEDLKEQLPEDDIDVYKNIAFVQAAMGDVGDAVETYKEILEITPGDCGIWTQIGLAEKLQADRMKQADEAAVDTPEYTEKLESAIAALTEVTTLCPDSLDAYLTLAEMYYFSGRQDQAAMMYEKLLEKDPENLEILNKVAYIHKSAESWAKAEPIYKQILDLDPTQDSARQGYATALQKQGKLMAAAAQYQKLIESDPEKYSGLYCNLANLYAMDAKDAEKAIETAMKGIAANASAKGCLTFFWGKGLELRGTDMVKTGLYDRAISTYRESKLKFSSILGDPNFGKHAQAQIERLDKLIEIAEQTQAKAKQQSGR